MTTVTLPARPSTMPTMSYTSAETYKLNARAIMRGIHPHAVVRACQVHGEQNVRALLDAADIDPTIDAADMIQCERTSMAPVYDAVALDRYQATVRVGHGSRLDRAACMMLTMVPGVLFVSALTFLTAV